MSDYERIAEAIDFIVAQVERQPSLGEVAAHVHMSPFHFQRLFSRWAGVTPKRFLQVLTLERAKQLLNASGGLLDVSETVGLSRGSRLYDHFVHLEAVTPGEFRHAGRGLTIEFGAHDTPFGAALIATTSRGVCRFAFLDGMDVDAHLHDLARSWPHADLCENRRRTREVVMAMFGSEGAPDRALSLHVSGTNFQVNVWRALLQIPPASVASYVQVADSVGLPGAARAVGQAVGANPVAFLIPCHRVIRQSGGIGGYHWGVTRKHAMHAWEVARVE